MSTAAEFCTEVTHFDNTHSAAVLFTEECCRPGLFGIFKRHDISVHITTGENVGIDKIFNLMKILSGNCSHIGKVKSERILLHKRTCLVDMVTQNGAKSTLKHMCGAVGTSYRFTAYFVVGRNHCIAKL